MNNSHADQSKLHADRAAALLDGTGEENVGDYSMELAAICHALLAIAEMCMAAAGDD